MVASSSMEDPFAKTLERSAIAQTLQQARASLAKPSRPYTPMDRSLFAGNADVDFMSTRSSLRTASRSTCGAVAEEDFGRDPEDSWLTPKGLLDTSLNASLEQSIMCFNNGEEVPQSGDIMTPVVASGTTPRPEYAEPPRVSAGYPAQKQKTRKQRLPATGSVSPEMMEDEGAEERLELLRKQAEALVAKGREPEWQDAWSATAEEAWALAQALRTPARRDQAAKLVVKLIEAKPPAGLLRLARAGFTLLDGARAPAAYTTIVRALFKLSKDEKQDDAFRTEKLLDPILQVLSAGRRLASSTELPVYLAGVLKNVSHSAENQAFLAQQGAIRVLTEMMLREDLAETKEKSAAVLVQVMATLRNLAVKPQHHRQFIVFNTLPALLKVCERYLQHRELLANVARILAKLSLHQAPCEVLAGDAHVQTLATVLEQHLECPSLVLRLTFVLGNLTAKNDQVRLHFMSDTGGGGRALLPRALELYLAKDSEHRRGGNAAGTKEAEEVLVKVVRLLANVSISDSIGRDCCAAAAIVSPLLDLLGSKTIAEAEELVLNVVAAITNLCFYDLPENLLFSAENKQLLCRLFRPLLLENYNPEALVEAARALGNITRHEDARHILLQLRVDEVLVILLEHSNRDLVFFLCGVLVNLAADPVCAQRLAQLKVVGKLVELLEDAADDPELLLCASKVLANLTLDAGVAWVPADLAALQRTAGALAARPAGSEDAETQSQLGELLRHLAHARPRGLASKDAAAVGTE